MRHVLTVLLFSCLSISAARADRISLYVDQVIECNAMVPLPIPAINSVYVVHELNPGTVAAQFRIVDTSGLVAANQSSPYQTVGTWNTDWSIAFGGCVTASEHVIATLNFY